MTCRGVLFALTDEQVGRFLAATSDEELNALIEEVKEALHEELRVDEVRARQLLIAVCHRLLTEWRAGHDWRWYGREGRWFDLSDLDFEFHQDWEDYSSLIAAWSYLDGFVDSMNHGFARFDSLEWEEAISILEEMTARLEAGKRNSLH